MKKLQNLLFLLIIPFLGFSQGENPEKICKWSGDVSQKEVKVGDVIDVIFNIKVENGWYMYSNDFDESIGPNPTIFEFTKHSSYKLMGNVNPIGAEKHYDDIWGDTVTYFKHTAKFKAKVKILSENPKITGYYEFQTCSEASGMCLPPTGNEIDFGKFLTVVKEEKTNTVETTESKPIETEIIDTTTASKEAENIDSSATYSTEEVMYPNEKEVNTESSIIPTVDKLDLDNPLQVCSDTEGNESKGNGPWLLFLFGFLGGLFALFTPCVFPMIPLTVSFFTKGGSDKGGIGRAVLYGFFIFLIYAALSIPFHLGSDPEVLNQLSTSWILNIAFFVIFMFFAFSFFGYYELTLPSKWSNSTDSAANSGGLFGIFFMALTLAIVSFSCTGPILGSVLANSLTDGPWPITAAMSGFGVALGLPFALFAMFPKLMSKLPQSGGWLNAVKVNLGFIEIALAFKFFSTADLVEHWGILKIEAFLIAWILCALGLAFYSWGKIKFPHDSPIQKLSLGRKILGAVYFAFAIYFASGFRYNEKSGSFVSLSMLSGLAPHSGYSWIYPSHCPNGLNCYHDFETAMEVAKEESKPIMIDFTGYGCVNCRRMEENVWSNQEIFDIINDDYILVSLYVDDREKLPEAQQGKIEVTLSDGTKKTKRIRTIGDKWSAFEIQNFHQIAQPYYFLLAPDGTLLNNPVGYTPDVDEYKNWLRCGLDAFNTIKQP